MRTTHHESNTRQTSHNPAYDFRRRHIGPNEKQTQEMLGVLGLNSLDELVQKTVPVDIQYRGAMNIPEPLCNHVTSDHILCHPMRFF